MSSNDHPEFWIQGKGLRSAREVNGLIKDDQQAIFKKGQALSL